MDELKHKVNKQNAETLILQIEDEIGYVERYIDKLKVKLEELKNIVKEF